MEEAIEQLQTKDTKERMAGVERLQILLEQSRKSLSANEVGSLVDASLVLLKDNNCRVAHGTLQALASAAALAGEHLKLHFNALIPAIVERLGDGKQPVRDASRQLLLALMEISSPTIIVERARGFAWGHRKWRVREEFARTVASAVNLFAATELPFQRMLLPSVLQLLEDCNSSVREAAMLCLEEMYRQGGSQFRDELQGYKLRPAQFKDIFFRFDTIEPVRGSLEPTANQIVPSKQSGTAERSKLTMPLPAAPRARTSPRMGGVKPPTMGDPPLGGRLGGGWGGTGDNRGEVGEHNQVDAIRVYSDKELVREMEKAASLLSPEQDWSVRISAMQRIEGLVVGGAAEYGSFMPLLKQLVGPLNSQLSDRRSSIVKQACQLLNLLSKELLVNFEVFAETFIPVLFKLVVITVLVIAESADICIKTMLRNCRVSRVLPKLVECAKHDRNSVLRARCCEYALLVLEQWGDSPEIQRSVELYEELIKCCVGDAMSDVRSTARACYREFSTCWPERARRIFLTLDASVQRLLNEEAGGGGPHKRYAFPSAQDWGSYGEQHQLRQQALALAATAAADVSAVAAVRQQQPVPSHPTAPAIAAAGNADNSSSSILSGLGLPLNKAYQRKSVDLGSEKSLNKVLQASQQQVNAIESMLKGVEKQGDKGTTASITATTTSRGGFGNVDRIGDVSGGDKGGEGAKGNLLASFRTVLADSGAIRSSRGVDRPSARDPPYPAAAPASNHGIGGTLLASTRPAGSGGVADHQFGGFSTERGYGNQHLNHVNAEVAGNEYEAGFLTGTRGGTAGPRLDSQERSGTRNGNGYFGGGEPKGAKRVMKADYGTDNKGLLLDREVPMDSSGIPGFQRPLLRQRSSGTGRNGGAGGGEENSLLMQFNARAGGEVYRYAEDVTPLSDALTEGLSGSSDWSARVAAFTVLGKLLQQGPKGVQEINQSFGMVMKLFSAHLDDPHHKVAQAALSTLADLVPACRKSFEAYLERILPHLFGRLVDPKEVIRQLGATTLEVIGNTYSMDSLLPALLRSLDQQRSPKAKVTVIEFAMVAFAKLALKNGETAAGTGLLKLWLAKLGPLANDKNPKLKETAVTGIISVYSHFDSTTVLNFILGLSIEEQSVLRRSLKQYTPRIEVDLMTYLQNKSHRVRTKTVQDQTDTASSTSETYLEGGGRSAYTTLTGGGQSMVGYTSSSINSDGGSKWRSSSRHEGGNENTTGSRLPPHHNHHPSSGGGVDFSLDTSRSVESSGSTGERESHGYMNVESGGHGGGRGQALKMKEVMSESDGMGVDGRSGRSTLRLNNSETERHQGATMSAGDGKASASMDSRESVNSELKAGAGAGTSPRETVSKRTQLQPDNHVKYDDRHVWKTNNNQRTVQEDNDGDSSVPDLLHQLADSGVKLQKKKKIELFQLLVMSQENDAAAWAEHFVQIWAVILEAIDGDDAALGGDDESNKAIRELALSSVSELLDKSNDPEGHKVVESSTEELLEKLLFAATDSDLKVSNAADGCKAVVLAELDPHRCLDVVVRLLLSGDEKLLVTCISSLTKVVSRLSSEDLMEQLPSFLPALFDAFGNRNADVRKTVVFCLVEIYIVLGKAFVPYLGSLSSTQLRLVTIYANRISQARTGTSLESLQL